MPQTTRSVPEYSCVIGLLARAAGPQRRENLGPSVGQPVATLELADLATGFVAGHVEARELVAEPPGVRARHQVARHVGQRRPPAGFQRPSTAPSAPGARLGLSARLLASQLLNSQYSISEPYGPAANTGRACSGSSRRLRRQQTHEKRHRHQGTLHRHVARSARILPARCAAWSCRETMPLSLVGHQREITATGPRDSEMRNDRRPPPGVTVFVRRAPGRRWLRLRRRRQSAELPVGGPGDRPVGLVCRMRRARQRVNNTPAVSPLPCDAMSRTACR